MRYRMMSANDDTNIEESLLDSKSDDAQTDFVCMECNHTFSEDPDCVDECPSCGSTDLDLA